MYIRYLDGHHRVLIDFFDSGKMSVEVGETIRQAICLNKDFLYEKDCMDEYPGQAIMPSFFVIGRNDILRKEEKSK